MYTLFYSLDEKNLKKMCFIIGLVKKTAPFLKLEKQASTSTLFPFSIILGEVQLTAKLKADALLKELGIDIKRIRVWWIIF